MRGGRRERPGRPRAGLLGRRYRLAPSVATALERVFSEPVGDVVVIEHSRYAQAHPGMYATTRPNKILLARSGADFVRDHEILLHEYFHVLRQWRTARLTRWRYVLESVRRGYWNNHYECEAREFAAAMRDRYRGYLRAASP